MPNEISRMISEGDRQNRGEVELPARPPAISMYVGRDIIKTGSANKLADGVD